MKYFVNLPYLVRVSLWFLYITIGGLLVLFLILKNAGLQQVIIKDEKTGNDISVDNTDPNYNVLCENGMLVILFFSGIILLTLIFYHSLR
jgi:hypothetical protein